MYLAVPPARTVPRYERGGDVSLVHERLDVRIDGVASFKRRERAAVNRRQRRLRSFPSESPAGALSVVSVGQLPHRRQQLRSSRPDGAG